jgi:hypothetical protein
VRVRLMSVSQNGYKSRDASLIASYTIVRDIKINLRKGDASVVLLHLFRWYDKNIEPLFKEDTGGYNPRHIEGSDVDSNHASGTAGDVRWKKHARGKKNTFTKAQKDAIHEQLKFYEGVIRWGEDYKVAPVDGMHFEVNKGPKELARIAKKCKDSDKPKPPYVPKDVKVDGSLGTDTIKLWQSVTKQTVNGKLTPTFVKWLQGFLRRVDHRVAIDGIFGSKTIGALQRYLKTPVDGVISEPRSDMVVKLQRHLNDDRF